MIGEMEAVEEYFEDKEKFSDSANDIIMDVLKTDAPTEEKEK